MSQPELQHASKKARIEKNPYLAHLNNNEDSSSVKLIPGATTVQQAEDAENGDFNPYNGRPFSQKYKDILAKRKSLPVHKQRQDFLDIIHSSNTMVLVGETGSGKTTQ